MGAQITSGGGFSSAQSTPDWQQSAVDGYFDQVKDEWFGIDRNPVEGRDKEQRLIDWRVLSFNDVGFDPIAALVIVLPVLVHL